MKSLFVIVAVLGLFALASAQPGLPELHRIRSVMFSAPINQGGNYARSALYLSKETGDPELVFAALVQRHFFLAEMSFVNGLRGDNFGLLSAIGNVSLENVTAQAAFNFNMTAGQDNQFTQAVELAAGMTYSAFLSRPNLRALFAFRVRMIEGYNLHIDYAVLMYEKQATYHLSPGFNWDRPNRPAMGPRYCNDSACLPPLNQMYSFRLESPYSCIGRYNGSALYLSAYTQQRNAPDLLWNGHCNAPTYFQASTSGSAMGLISYIGNMPIEQVSASKAFYAFTNVFPSNRFIGNPLAQSGTYVLMTARNDMRSLFVFSVATIPSGGIHVTYAALDYALQKVTAESRGFTWDGRNYY